MAISANYIDSSNKDLAMAELQVNSLVDARAGELLNILKQKNEVRIVSTSSLRDEERIPLKWKDFKMSHNHQ